ncbi:glycosyltransferase family 4 protein [Winogradskyella aquimaris]|uniref:Glycosyltransferase family 4 protein n=1 Tax=Winogradskyella aquimaris TaxID=864074 RepID=A0ABU5EQK5_9FLAO|nr:glycosyltransferase family 4 protein [Winogradskyella aquimaris]MDY2587161.1 glycosyltransferase family 4 protein [Winogradskyella aquimaris]
MHICFITSEYPKEGFSHGGIGSFVKTISHLLALKNHKVTVLGINTYANEDERFKDEHVNVIRLKPKKVKGLTWVFNNKSINKELKQIHESNPLDIVESAELGLAFIKKIPSVKYVIRLHGGHHFFAEAEQRKVSRWKGFQEKRSFSRADGFIAVSKYVMEHTAKYLSYHNKPIAVLMSPVNLEIFKPRLDIEVKLNRLLFAGTVCEKKGIYQLVKAMPKVINHHPDVELHIYGRDWFFKDGKSYISFLKDYISKLNLKEDSIQFRGTVDMNSLAEYYASADVCVFPSLMETQGLVAPEAMAMGKLVIFTECGPGPEIIEDKKTGLLCNPYDVDDIANKIIWALGNKELSQDIAERGRVHALNILNKDSVVNRNIDFYYKIKDY